MKPFKYIDENTTLHLPRPELATPLFAAIDENRAFLRAWLPWVDATCSAEDTKTFIHESMEHNTNGTRLTTFIMSEGKLVGSLGVVNFTREHRKCELGYWLVEGFQGKGLMTKTLKCFVGHLFKTKGMNRVEAQVLAGNERSSAVLIRSGFKKEGVHRQSVLLRKGYFDMEVYGLLKEEWALGEEF